MADSSFLDFVDNIGKYIPGGAAAIPSWLSALLVKKPSIDASAALPYYDQVAAMGANANEFANTQADFYNKNYRPAAIAFNDRAQGVGGQADLAEAAARGGATFDAAHGAAVQGLNRSMAGVDPNSGAAQARRGAIDAAAMTGRVDAMNKARTGREQYGDTLRAQALPFLATAPNYNTGVLAVNAAGSGINNIAKTLNDQYRLQAGDVTKALKLPGDAADEAKRTTANNASLSSAIKPFLDWMGGGQSDSGSLDLAANALNSSGGYFPTDSSWNDAIGNVSDWF